jgi:chemotaxis protein methyltransferase CheR
MTRDSRTDASAPEPDGGDAPEEIEEIEEIEIRLLLEAIFARYEHDLRGYAPASLRRRVRAALARSGCRNLGELQHAVLTEPAVFTQVIEDLTVRVTEMFRDPEMYLMLRERVVPILRTYPLLRIWHAGCATGEEAYATAIVLSEAGLYERAQIYASDISAAALEQAQQGTYPAERLALFAANYVAGGGRGDFAGYVTAAYGGIAINQALRRNILFLQHDLVGDHVFGEMHVVFCRNVLIYFGKELRRRVIAKLVQSLCPGGFLCLGQSERLVRTSDAQDLVEFAAEGRMYRHA